MELRPYQNNQIGLLRQGIGSKHFIQMLMSPTGSGKTEVAKAIIKGSQAKGRRTWFIVDSVGLLDQTLTRFHKDGLYAGAIQADHPCTDHSKPLQVATVQSLRPRLQQMLNLRPPELVLIDEAHVLFQVHIDLIEWCRQKNVPVIGLSATPWRRGLGKIFDRLVSCVSISDLTEQGFLVPTQLYVPSVPSLKGIRTNTSGDYIEDELAKVMGDGKLVGDIVQHWRELGENRKTLVFACNVIHSKQLAEAFFNAGIMAAHIDGYMDRSEIDQIMALYKEGKIKVLVSVAMLIKGFDDPATSCLVLARPTRSLMLHYQMLGRGLRLSPETGKRDCIIIDHAGNLLLNGRPCDEVPDALDTGEGESLDRRKQNENESEASKDKHCPKCKTLFSGLLCPRCGHQIELADGVPVVNGKLIKLEDRKDKIGPKNKERIYSELVGYAREKGKKDGWAIYAYNAFMGESAPKEWQMHPQASEPSSETLQWVKGYNIRKFKSAQKRGGFG